MVVSTKEVSERDVRLWRVVSCEHRRESDYKYRRLHESTSDDVRSSNWGAIQTDIGRGNFWDLSWFAVDLRCSGKLYIATITTDWSRQF